MLPIRVSSIGLIALMTQAAASPDLRHLQVFEGLRVARIELEGNRITKDHVIRRELRTEIGRPLSLSDFEADLQRLDNLDIFSSVKVTGHARDGGVELVLRLRELPFAVPYISYDITDEDGLSLGPALKSVNMLGRDVFVAGYLLYGGRTLYLLDLSAPWVAGNHVSFDLDLSRVERENELDGFQEISYEISPRIGTYVGDHGRAAVSMSYMRVEADLPGHTLSTSNRDHLVCLGGSLGYDTRDSWGNPHVGWQNEIEFSQTGGVLPGDGDFWTTHVDVRRFQPAGRDRTIVLGWLLSLQQEAGRDNFPEYMDYRLGGANSIRGFEVSELGRTLRGRHQLLATFEFRGPLLPVREYELLNQTADLGLAWALFADSGLAWNGRSQLEWDRVATGAGIGIRLLMPVVDMTRLDFAVSEHGDLRVHFAVFSKLKAQRFRFR